MKSETKREMRPRIVVLGAGLAGLSAAWHLARQSPDLSRIVLEKDDSAGGLCRSRSVDGFTFDYTGHYLHLRDPAMTAWVERLLGDELVEVERRSLIQSHGVRLEFPFQANLHGLPPELVARCLIDFVRASDDLAPPNDAAEPFGRWARRVFGDGIAEAFMIPYNAKLFGVDADELTSEWVAWAVPRPDLEQVVRGALGIANRGMGYNPRFRYPRCGGIGSLPAALAECVADDLQLGAPVARIDAAGRRVQLADGREFAYERLISTLPLAELLHRIEGLVTPGGAPPLSQIAARLRWTAVIDVGLGIDRPEIAGGAHWIYFPEPEYPFYRAGFPSNVCRAMAPEGCSSISVEFSQRPDRPRPSHDELVAAARGGLERAGLLSPEDRIVLSTEALIDPAYVIFDAERTRLVDEALARLDEAGILSIGRFGAWTYSYMERALIDGKTAAERVAAALTPAAR
ncbi:MAG: FAD-dependent oxidoreductase [Acidobacteriota bacterium]|nr:MAG: FAD-dependent oxidoreductase [Acidobacteriota bacterium]